MDKRCCATFMKHFTQHFKGLMSIHPQLAPEVPQTNESIHVFEKSALNFNKFFYY